MVNSESFFQVMESLSHISTVNVCQHLKLNHNILEKLNLKIPNDLSCLLFNFYSQYGKELNEGDLNFFSQTLFSSLVVNRKFHKLKDFFGRINKRNLKFVKCFLKFGDSSLSSIDTTLSLLEDTNTIEKFQIVFLIDKHQNDFFYTFDKISKVFNLLENSCKTLIELKIAFSCTRALIVFQPEFQIENLLRKCLNLKTILLSNKLKANAQKEWMWIPHPW